MIYCKFWELDTDHDLIIDAQDLARHSDHGEGGEGVRRGGGEGRRGGGEGRGGRGGRLGEAC